jgi:hypothetical protein
MALARKERTMYTYTHLEVLSCKDCMKVASLDAKIMSSDTRTYVESNSLSYYVAINTWLLMLKEYSGYAWTHFAELIQTKGLIFTINYCQEQARIFIQHGENDDFMKMFYTSLHQLNSDTWEVRNINKVRSVTFLFLLRYLKRFSPNNNDLIQKASMRDFIAVENRLKQLAHKELSPFVVSLVRDEVAHMYPWKKICRRIASLTIDDMEFSSGVCRGTRSDLSSKCKFLSRSEYSDEFFPKPFGVRIITAYSACSRNFVHEDNRIVKPQAVPKSYKASRIIAPEHVVRQGMGKAIERIFRDIDNSRKSSGKTPCMDLEDQTINQKLAQIGSESGIYATLDASHASDMISKVLFRSIFPPEFVKLIEPYMDTHIEYDNGSIKAMQMMSTAGHSLTFRLETIVYLAIARAASHLCERCGCERIKDFDCWAYGDDTIVPSYAAETAIDFFSSLGLVINVDKSYFSQELLYRESCGEEYYMGTECTSLYFPRFPLKGSVNDKSVKVDSFSYHDGRFDLIENSTTMLISLQKKLYPYSKDAAFFILEILRASDRKLTTSIPYDEASTDPWGLLDTGKPVKHPTYELVKCSVADLGKLKYQSSYVPRAALYCPNAKLVRAIVKCSDEPTFSSFGAYEEFQQYASLDSYHSCPAMVATEEGDDGHDDWVYQAYKYREFLLHGPKYDSSLDELLGVSSPSMSYSEFCGKRQLKLKYTVK